MSKNDKELTFAIFFRKIFDWEWYTDSKTFHLFFHCVMRANHKPSSYQGIPLKRGQFVTGRKKLSVETGLSEQEVRTILKRLKSTNELTIQSTRRNSIITVNNYDEYQAFYSKNEKINQRTNREITTNNNRDILISKDINISLSSIEENSKNEISDDEREILKKYLKKNNPNIKNIRAYLKKVIENGDYKDILKEEKAKLKKEDKSNIKDDIKKVRDERSAIRFLAKYGNQLSDVQLPEVEKIMKEYNFESFDDVVKASYRYKE